MFQLLFISKSSVNRVTKLHVFKYLKNHTNHANLVVINQVRKSKLRKTSHELTNSRLIYEYKTIESKA